MTRASFFIPPMDSMWRMLAGWPIPLAIAKAWRNETFMKGIHRDISIDGWKKATGDNTGDGSEWVKRYHAWVDAKLAKGGLLIPQDTVIRINRIHMGQSDDKTSVEILASPEPNYCPKKAGGTAKGRLRLFVTVEQLNTFPDVEVHHE